MSGEVTGSLDPSDRLGGSDLGQWETNVVLSVYIYTHSSLERGDFFSGVESRFYTTASVSDAVPGRMAVNE